ncbi:class I glutamine amidotransferase-like protein [Polychaeton citri CBS 116435]|uniref:Class I glutamine amidotransferase-like protein n=1 Tax=Polychaeton citri CBS 116435 TaxID=1314669 RepID=A0A9P4ULE8_9PEZI|nr:class I glutamine amidotransferase-like protein [Polychaeton citri CBS 116435]
MPTSLARLNGTIHVGIILMNGETELLDVAPIDLLNGLDRKFVSNMPLPDSLKAQALDIVFHWVNETGSLARMTSGATIQTTESFSTCPSLDIVLMGAHIGPGQPSETELVYVRKAYEECSAFISICGGMMVPLAAGLLDGKTCTAPRELLNKLRTRSPEVDWVERRWVQDGKLWTSGTLLNGLDLMKAFVEHIWGGPGTLAESVIAMGAWPIRQNEFRDGE